MKQVIQIRCKNNKKSQKVMETIKMRKITEFQHPVLDIDHPLSWHVLYEISKQEFKGQNCCYSFI